MRHDDMLHRSTDKSAGCGIRTHTPFRTAAFEAAASAIPPTRLEQRSGYPSVGPITFPVVTATPDPAGAARRRVVIAEDEALIRLDLAEMLAEEGYDVVGQAEDGEKAVELVLEHRPDLVILDIKMPRLDGIAAAEQIAGQRIAPVVILTAFSQRDLVERARDAGAMAYLVKPFDQNDLVPAIEMAVSRFTELRQLESEVGDLTERLETRKLVDRAKGILQQRLGLSEPDSFRWIQKTAMDLRLSMRQVAEGVVTHGPDMGGGSGDTET
jgi:two-component system, response regulator PdtaR